MKTNASLLGMTEAEFAACIRAFETRIERLKAVRAGTADVRRVHVKKHTVPGFTVRAHYRNIITLREQPARMTKRRRA